MILRLLLGLASFTISSVVIGQPLPSSGALDLLVPSAGKVSRIRLDIQVADFDAEKAWERFLDRWFDYFDRDSSGTLSASEAARVIPLPSSTGKDIALDFAQGDVNKDGQLSRLEFKTSLRAAGFTPVVARVQPSDPILSQLNDVIVRYLDRSGKGQLTQVDVERASEMLRRFDDNEDEVLTVPELLIGAPKAARSASSGVRLMPAEVDRPADSTLRLPLSAANPANVSTGAHYSVGVARLTIDNRNIVWKGPAHTSRLFCLAQFDNLRGDRPHVERKQVERDPAARLLLGLFEVADRDSDGRLTDAEIRHFLDLIEEGSSCQVIVTVEDRGQSLFDLFDINGDARLDYRELLDAPKRFRANDSAAAVVIPSSLNMAVQRGAAASAFGPLPLASAPAPSAVAILRVRMGPRWFQAMDHNQDGFVSPREFIGPTHAFRRLDVNGDGLISADEAGRADAPAGKSK